MLIDGDIFPWARTLLQIRQPQQQRRKGESRWGLGAVRISEATFEVVAQVSPAHVRRVGFDRVTDEKGERWVWVDAAVVERLRDPRRPDDSDVDVILRLAEMVKERRPVPQEAVSRRM
jgi:hypothetical protein